MQRFLVHSYNKQKRPKLSTEQPANCSLAVIKFLVAAIYSRSDQQQLIGVLRSDCPSPDMVITCMQAWGYLMTDHWCDAYTACLAQIISVRHSNFQAKDDGLARLLDCWSESVGPWMHAMRKREGIYRRRNMHEAGSMEEIKEPALCRSEKRKRLSFACMHVLW